VRNALGRSLWDLAQHWHDERVSRRAAALSYYTLLSLVPLLVISDTLLGALFGHDAIRAEIDRQVGALIGPDQAIALRAMLSNAPSPSLSSWRTAASAVLTFVAASGVFLELKDSLNGIWRVKAPAELNLWRLVRGYFAPLTMVLGFGFLLLVSLILSAFVSMLMSLHMNSEPTQVAVLAATDQATTLALALILFAAIFRFLPDVKVRWRDVWFGALITALLFMAGRLVIGFYLGTADFTERYGSAGAVVAIVAWVFYSAQILFTGAVLIRDRSFASGYVPRTIRGATLESVPHDGGVGEAHSKA
jgi:membrane protein